MSSSDPTERPHTGARPGEQVSRRAALLAPLAIAACGFTPVYGPGGTGTKLNGQVQVAAPGSRQGFLLGQRIEERLGTQTNARYAVSVTVSTNTQGLEISPAGNTNRFNLIGAAGYVMTDQSSGAQIASGVVNSFTGYSATDSTVVTLAAQRDAEERLMVILGDQIVARLLSTPIPA